MNGIEASCLYFTIKRRQWNLSSPYSKHNPEKVHSLAYTIPAHSPGGDLFSESANVDRWKCFSCWCITLEKHEYLHRGTHGSTSLCEWKSQETQPTHSPPFFCQPKQPLRRFSARNPKTHQLFPPQQACCVSRYSITSKESAICSALNTSFRETQKKSPNPSPSVSIREATCDPRSSHSLPFILRQKRRAEWKGNWGAYWSCWVGLSSSHKLPSLLSSSAALTWLKPHINYQPPQWNVSLPLQYLFFFLLVYCQKRTACISHCRSRAERTEREAGVS